jgi:peptide/nickel transport system substrate-binding protein
VSPPSHVYVTRERAGETNANFNSGAYAGGLYSGGRAERTGFGAAKRRRSQFYHRDSPASASIHEEATISSVAPFMGVFNNLVIFKQDEKQNRPEFIVPDLAESWSWSRDYTRLGFRLR